MAHGNDADAVPQHAVVNRAGETGQQTLADVQAGDAIDLRVGADRLENPIDGRGEVVSVAWPRLLVTVAGRLQIAEQFEVKR